MHMDLEKNYRGRQLDTKSSDLNEANLLPNVGLEGFSDWGSSAGETSPTLGDLRRSWAAGPFFLPGMEKWEIISVNPV